MLLFITLDIVLSVILIEQNQFVLVFKLISIYEQINYS